MAMMLFATACTADVPAREPPMVQVEGVLSVPVMKASDQAKLAEHMNKNAVVVGRIATAEWSASGKVMIVTFEGVDEKKFSIATFERTKKSFNDAFGGDFRNAVIGSDVRLSGEIQPYGGYDKDEPGNEGRLQMLLVSARQVTITKLAA